MPQPSKGPRLGGGPAHERLMLANLASSLFMHKRITTTEARAKRLRPYAERLITLAKRGDLHARRRAAATLRHKNNSGYTLYRGSALHEVNILDLLFREIGPAMADRPGGYTRITKIGRRKGDSAPMAVIELVMEPMSPKQAVVKEAEGATKRASSSRKGDDKPAEKASKDSAAAVDDADEAKSPDADDASDDATSAPAADTDSAATDESNADDDASDDAASAPAEDDTADADAEEKTD